MGVGVCVRMYMCMYVNVYVCIFAVNGWLKTYCTCMHAYIYESICMYMYVHVYVCISAVQTEEFSWLEN